MATFRQIHVKIWKDGWFLDLPPDHKLLFIYLFSNERANLFGLYDLPIKVISFETDVDAETVSAGLERFASEGKAFHEDGWIWVRSLLAYNAQNLSSPKTQAHLKNTLDEIPDIPLKRRALAYYRDKLGYTYPNHTQCIPILQEQDQDQEQEQEQEQEQQQEQDAVDAVVGRELLLEFGVREPSATNCAASPLGYITGWIADATAKGRRLENPQGYVVKQLQTGIPPPQPVPEWQKFIGDHLCPTCHMHPCACEEEADDD